MSDRLSSDLAALRIDRDRPAASGRWVRRLVWLAALVAVGAVGWEYGVPWVTGRWMRPRVEVTQISMVSPAQADVTLSSTGYVVPQKVTKVGAKVSGRIAKVHVREGEHVEEGQLLAELESADALAAVDSAKARVSLAQAQVATARAQLAETEQQARRERKLADEGVQGVATAQDLEARALALRRQVEAAEASVRAARAEVAALTVNVEYLRVTAPMSGTVLAKPTGEGELVGLMAASLVELADFSTLMVETDVPEARMQRVELGGPAEIQLDALPDRRLRGRVREISPRVDRAKATITVKVEFIDPADGVLPDMAARVSFLTHEIAADAAAQPAKPVIPASAIAERGGAKVVFVVENDVVRLRPITLGAAVGSGFEVLAGPPVGTRVVRAPGEDLHDGQPVDLQDDS